MKVTRRSLVRIVTVSAALPVAVSAQGPAGASASFEGAPKSGAAPKTDPEMSAASGEFQAAARALAAVKLPRSVEPATRFEA